MEAPTHEHRAGSPSGGRTLWAIGHEWWLFLAITGIFGLAAVAWTAWLTSDLAVFTETRSYSIYHSDIDALRFVLLPHLDWGQGRLTGLASFQITGQICGTDAGCTNAATAVLIGVVVTVLMIHTRQLSRSATIAVLVACLWLLSAPTLASSIWQSTRFDLLAMIMALGASSVWWWAFGKPHIRAATGVILVIASVVMLSLAFNAKEVDYYLIGIMPMLAVLRGIDVQGGVRRNLLLCVVPMAYGLWFITYGLTHITPAYAANGSGASILDGVLKLLALSFGLRDVYLGLPQAGPLYNMLSRSALIGYALWASVVTVLVVAAWRRGAVPASGRPDRETLRKWPVELYLLAVAIVPTVVGARSLGSGAYYMVIPYWAILTLGALILRRLTSRVHGRALAIAGLAFLLPALIAYGSLFTPTSAYRQLVVASDRINSTGRVLQTLLAGRTVTDVLWRTLGEPRTAFYVLHQPGLGNVASRELWPYLMDDLRSQPQVTPLTTGTVRQVRTNALADATPGRVVVVVDDKYGLLLLTHQGQILYEAPLSEALIVDGFSRPVDGGWGEPPRGPAWVASASTGAKVDGGVGWLTVSSAPGGGFERAAVGARDIAIEARWSIDALPTRVPVSVHFWPRDLTSGNQYRFYLNLTPSGELYANFAAAIGGTTTLIAGPVVVTSAYTPGAWWHVRIEAVGADPTTLRVRAWQDGDPEPTGWALAVTDATPVLQVASDAVRLGVYAGAGETTLPLRAAFDDVVVSSLATGDAP